LTLLDPQVTRRKLAREFELWDANAALYRARGWLMIDRGDRFAEVAFLTGVGFGPRTLTVAPVCIRLEFENYDLWPPSLEFIDPISREPVHPPVNAFVDAEQRPQNILVAGHPKTGRPFLCVRGTRQYHTHPQHSGDSWLLARAQQAGSLFTLCDRVYTTMVRNIIGLQATIQTFPAGLAQQAEINLQLAQGDVDELRERLGRQPAPVPFAVEALANQ
jgi:hypothetical protein